MERKHLSTRLLSYLLTFAMLLSFAVPVGAAGGGESQASRPPWALPVPAVQASA